MSIQYVREIKSEEEFAAEKKKPGVKVFELHTTWCGPVKCMANTYKSMYFQYDEVKPGVQFFTVDTSKVPALKKYAGLSKPHFLVTNNNKEVATVEGVDAPQLRRHIHQILFPDQA